MQIADRAFIFYFVHPERTGLESFTFEDYMPIEYKRTSLQIAELDFEDGVLLCDRDRYLQED